LKAEKKTCRRKTQRGLDWTRGPENIVRAENIDHKKGDASQNCGRAEKAQEKKCKEKRPSKRGAECTLHMAEAAYGTPTRIAEIGARRRRPKAKNCRKSSHNESLEMSKRQGGGKDLDVQMKEGGKERCPYVKSEKKQGTISN